MTHDVHLEKHTKSSAVRLGIFHPASLPSKGLYVEEGMLELRVARAAPRAPSILLEQRGNGVQLGKQTQPTGLPSRHQFCCLSTPDTAGVGHLWEHTHGSHLLAHPPAHWEVRGGGLAVCTRRTSVLSVLGNSYTSFHKTRN